MAKFHGLIGYVTTTETAPGVHSEVPTEKPSVGDVLRSAQRWEATGNLNEDLVLSNRISVVADAFALENFQFIRYVSFNGVKWKVLRVEIERPRLILTLGGVYNG